MEIKKIAVGCDHGAYELKNLLIEHLKSNGYECEDCGTYSPDSVHYPIYAHKVCRLVQCGTCDVGILLCGTGIGMSMAANKHRGIRAALCADTYSARYTRMHNDANVLCLGAMTTGRGLAFDIADAFLNNEFEGGRHAVRIAMFRDFENDCGKEN
ncbi:MAG: ribose 5-phosphate isomerase B [Firmicutes bacterium]|nr:ribose 5-phosphate isomerase B [Bacillota bacterium]